MALAEAAAEENTEGKVDKITLEVLVIGKVERLEIETNQGWQWMEEG